MLQTDPLLSKTRGMKLASPGPELKEIHRPTPAVSGEADPQQPVATGLRTVSWVPQHQAALSHDSMRRTMVGRDAIGWVLTLCQGLGCCVSGSSVLS